MANKLLKHLLGYGDAGNAGAVAATEAKLTAIGSTAVVGVCTDWSGNIYLSDAEKHIIIKVTEDGIVKLFAGLAGTSGRTNGIAEDARFNEPMGIACDRSGNIYVADCGNNQIRKIDSNGYVSLLAGSLTGTAGSTDGVNFDARFNKPVDVTVDYSGNVYVSDSGNNKIRIIRGANTLTVAGTGTAGDVIGKGDVAQFDNPYGIACDRSGKIFLADSGNSKIKMIQTDFTVYNVPCTESLTGDAFEFGSLKYLEVDNSGFIYVVDYSTTDELSRLLKFNQEGVGGVIVDPIVTNIGIAVSPNQSIYVTQSGVDFNSSSSSESSQTPPP
jgi:sugar lactone lactonase YvrE